MLFNSWIFIVFLVVVFCLFHGMPRSVPKRGMVQVLLLTAASMVFYGYHLPWLVLLLVLSLLLNGWVARTLIRLPAGSPGRKRVLVAGLVGNLGALGFFKYAGLIASTLLPEEWHGSMAPWITEIPLPIGISFYTFQGLSLVLDSYWGRREGMESLIADADAPRRFHAKVWFYIGFFPQLVAGPIIKAHDFVNQIRSKSLADIDWRDATRKLVTGFFLKMVVADNLKEVTAAIDFPYFEGLSSLHLLLLLYAFSFQIFADFAGYSLIAMGLGRLFGYTFPLNFNFPYLSRSITEFWRRWHISLSTWLRDYLYIPLGGNRKGHWRTYLNLFIVMFLGGLWHGAAWSYAVWGIAHGILLAVERAWRDASFARLPRAVLLPLSALRILLVFNVVSFLWLLFKLPDFSHVVRYLRLLAEGTTHVPPQVLFVVMLFSVPVVMYHAWGGWVRDMLARRMGAKMYLGIETVCIAALLFLILTNSGTPGAFIYFQF